MNYGIDVLGLLYIWLVVTIGLTMGVSLGVAVVGTSRKLSRAVTERIRQWQVDRSAERARIHHTLHGAPRRYWRYVDRERTF